MSGRRRLAVHRVDEQRMCTSRKIIENELSLQATAFGFYRSLCGYNHVDLNAVLHTPKGTALISYAQIV